MNSLTAAELATSIRFNRTPRSGPLTLFAVMRNEIYFLPAFLAHYRGLGIEQFVIVDDASTDGTSEYLARQPDCCSGMSHVRYGERVAITGAAHGGLSGRAGPMLKRVVPDHFLRGTPVLIADADEFLLLPSRIPDVPSLVRLMKERGWKTVAASLIDFFPPSLADLDDATPPASLAELLARFGYFDAVPFVALKAGRHPRKSGVTSSARLFTTCGIRQVPAPLAFLPEGLTRLLPLPPPPAAWFKTPLIMCDADTYLDGAHEASVTPPPDILLAMAHFKFNGESYQRIKSAIALKAHAHKARKYEHYEQMLRIMKQRGMGFLGPRSKRYESPEQLIAEGLSWLPG